MTKLKHGDLVQYTAEFCRSTGQFAGPTPFARGEVISIEPFSVDGDLVDWIDQDGQKRRVLDCNLKRIQR